MRLLFNNGTLGQERNLLEEMKIGTVDMVNVSGALMTGFAPRLQVFSLALDFTISWAYAALPVGGFFMLIHRVYKNCCSIHFHYLANLLNS